MNRSRWTRTSKAALGVLLALLVLPPPGASAAGTVCLFSRIAARVSVVVSSGAATISRTGTGTITVNGLPCLEPVFATIASVTNTDTIGVTGTSGDESVTLDLAGGPFAPGRTAESDNSDEIEFSVDLGGGTGDSLTIDGSSGRDEIFFGTSGINLHLSPNETDIAIGGIEAFTANSGLGDDISNATGTYGPGGRFPGALQLDGGDGDDFLYGGSAADTIDGGDGADQIVGEEGANVLDGGAGNDFIFGGGDGDNIIGGEGNDSIFGYGGNDRIDGGEGNDGLSGNEGDDTVDGGPGDDLMQESEGPAPAFADDIMVGGPGNDTMVSGPGDDTLDGGPGDDAMDGQDGVDAVDFANAPAGVTVDLSAGTAVGSDGTDTLAGTETILGSIFDDTLVGDAGANSILGNDGDDRLTGGEGDDALDGGDGEDTASYATAATGVTAAVGGSVTGAGADTLTGIENLIGSPQDDVLRGDGFANILSGGKGNDLLAGRSGADVLRGAGGNDKLNGGKGKDVCKGGPGVDTLKKCEA